MKFRKIYLEISNVCNLKCSFCPGTTRAPKMMSEAEFRALMPKLRPWSDFLYFHLMGEPLLHPQLERFLQIAGEAGFRVILTTNGTLLERQKELLLASPGLHKVNISLHSFEANEAGMSFASYLDACLSYGQAASGKKLTVYRLWNQGGLDSKNEEILRRMEQYFPREAHGLGTEFIWNTERNLTGPPWRRRKATDGISAMGCGIRLACCATGRWFPAAWIPTEPFHWGIYFGKRWKKFSTPRWRRKFATDSPKGQPFTQCADGAGSQNVSHTERSKRAGPNLGSAL